MTKVKTENLKELTWMGKNIDACTQAIRAEQWKAVLHDCRNSGLSNKAYCVEHGIPIKTFYYWQHKLRQGAVEAMALNTGSGKESPSAIVPVSVSEKRWAGITIHSGKITVEIADGTSSGAIETVLTALQRLC